jgi:hypothetical protein
MVITLRLILMILALVCFGAAALNVSAPRINLTAAGLFLLTLAMTVTV